MIEIKSVGGEAYVNTENDWLRERLSEYEKIGSVNQCKIARMKMIPMTVKMKTEQTREKKVDLSNPKVWLSRDINSFLDNVCQTVNYGTSEHWVCPVCDAFLAFVRCPNAENDLKPPRPLYCSYCGQRLDWSPEIKFCEEVE